MLKEKKYGSIYKGLFMKETESFDRLFSELNQFTQAATERELNLAGILHEVLQAWEKYDIHPKDISLFEKAFSLMQSVYKHKREEN